MNSSKLKKYVENKIAEIYVSAYEEQENITDTDKAVNKAILEVLQDICKICNERGRY